MYTVRYLPLGSPTDGSNVHVRTVSDGVPVHVRTRPGRCGTGVGVGGVVPGVVGGGYYPAGYCPGPQIGIARAQPLT